MTILFAFVAVAAALVSIGGPSYRAEIRHLLARHVPQLEQDMVDLVTGFDPDRLEVTFDGLDERIGTLTAALERVTATEGLTPETAKELLLKTEQNIRLDDVVARLADQTAALTEIPRQAQLIDALKTEQDAAAQSVQTALDETRSEFAATREAVDALAVRLTPIEGGIAALEAFDGDVASRLAALDGRLQEVTAGVAALVDMNERVAQLAAARQDEELPILALLQLEKALSGSGPYEQELTFARRYLGNRAGAMMALDTLADGAASGVNSLADLRRDFMLIANQMGASVSGRQSWTDRMTSWFEMLIGASSVPEALSGGRVASSIATVDAALERGELSLAVQETSTILAARRNGALEEWLIALRKRYDVARALGELNDAVYGRDSAARQTQGTRTTN
ncbi:MAG: hypothetical protein HQ481_06855 [Alphaproteobacteria bacterium]|nr:hypothetical protein [Alphaproteobacteria bacterium]